jgi:hypothetical protein
MQCNASFLLLLLLGVNLQLVFTLVMISGAALFVKETAPVPDVENEDHLLGTVTFTRAQTAAMQPNITTILATITIKQQIVLRTKVVEMPRHHLLLLQINSRSSSTRFL